MSVNPNRPPTATHHGHTALPSLDQCLIALDNAMPGTFNHLLLRLLKRELEQQPDPWWDDEEVQE